jgi:MFS family permease
MISAVFSMQGWGVILSTVLVFVLLQFPSIPLDHVWRIAIIVGALPTAIVIYFRAQMIETEEFTKADAQRQQKRGIT